MADCPLHESAPACPVHAEKHGTHACDCPTIGCSETDAGFMALFGAVGVLPPPSHMPVPLDAGDASPRVTVSTTSSRARSARPSAPRVVSVLQTITGSQVVPTFRSAKRRMTHEIRGARLPVRHVCMHIAGALSAQETISYGTISGRVTDPQGAVVPGAASAARHVETESERSRDRSRKAGSAFPISGLAATRSPSACPASRRSRAPWR